MCARNIAHSACNSKHDRVEPDGIDFVRGQYGVVDHVGEGGDRVAVGDELQPRIEAEQGGNARQRQVATDRVVDRRSEDGGEAQHRVIDVVVRRGRISDKALHLYQAALVRARAGLRGGADVDDGRGARTRPIDGPVGSHDDVPHACTPPDGAKEA
jgi:hypothetical protein